MAASLIIRGAESINISGDYNPGDMVKAKGTEKDQKIIDLDFDKWISERKVYWILDSGDTHLESDLSLIKKAVNV